MKVVLLTEVALLLGSFLGLQHPGNCQIVEADMPIEIKECFQLLSNKTNQADLNYETSDEIYIQCLKQFLWKGENIQWSDFNITEKDKGVINSLIGSLVRNGRQKRQAGPNIFPRTGFRIRREYRRISDGERFAFHSAINQMKTNGQYDTFANIHQGIVVNSAHGGPNFLGWHRVYLAIVEESLRMINPGLSIPYWDSTLDFDMVDPVESIIWTETFLGNGNGFVTTGPFANWIAGANQLTRNIGGGSTLFTKEMIRMVLSRCRIRDIVFPTAMDQFNLERYHGGPHNWVGGQMSGLNTAAHDPVFFLHHAFVDYIWELFRIRQATFCGVNPSTDYPPTMGLHAAERPMDGFPEYRNIDGYQSYWTRFWYRYELSPTCSFWQPYCGSPYLRCDIVRQRCVSLARMGPSPTPIAAGFAGTSFAADSPSSPASAMAARAQAATVVTGPRFVAPPPEPRTQDARLSTAPGRRRRSANQNLETKTNTQTKDETPNTEQNIPKAGKINGLTTSVSDGIQLLPVPAYHEETLTDLLRPPAQNTFIINDHIDISMWAFIPVKVLYTSNLESPVEKFLNSTFQHTKQTNVSFLNSSSIKSPNKKCIQDESGAMQIRIQSVGLNYNGEYSGYALIDRHLPADSATAYIGIKSPEVKHTKVILSAFHSCGLMCQAYCFVQNSVPPEFKPCSGALKISNHDRNAYGLTYKEAVLRVWQGVMYGGGVQNENLRIIFDCSNDDKATWYQGNSGLKNTMSSFKN